MNKQDKKRLENIKKEFARGFEVLADVKKGIVIYGSARTKPSHPYYKATYKLAYKLAKKGYAIITGAGGGIMEAGNKGAYDAGGISVGLNIELDSFQSKINSLISTYALNIFILEK